MGLRRKGRELALQTLYSLSFFEELPPYEDKLWEIAAGDKGEDDEAQKQMVGFARELLDKITPHLDNVDELIQKHLHNWDFERLTLLDKNLLRLAVGELMYCGTPAAIVMDEAVEIAKRFCTENSGRFVNGILNAVAQELGGEKA